MANLEVVAVLTAKPGSEQLIKEALSALVESTRAEDGCVAYHLFASQADPAVFVTVEEWTSQQALDAHLKGPGVQGALAAATEHFAAPPAIHPLAPIA